jgi:hypothetical protein
MQTLGALFRAHARQGWKRLKEKAPRIGAESVNEVIIGAETRN